MKSPLTKRKLFFGVTLFLLIVIPTVSYLYIKDQNAKNWKKSEEYYRKADYKKAAELLNKLGLPQEPEKLRIYGQTMFAVGEYKKARLSYEKLFQLQKDPFAKLMLGNIANQEKDYDTATKTYQSLIDSNPNYIQAYVNLATAYRIQNRTQKAIDVTKMGIKENATSSSLYELLLTLTLDNKESADFKNAYENLKRLNPQSAALSQIKM